MKPEEAEQDQTRPNSAKWGQTNMYVQAQLNLNQVGSDMVCSCLVHTTQHKKLLGYIQPTEEVFWYA